MDIESLLQPLDPLDPLPPRSQPPRPRQPWHWRLGQWVSAYLPLLLMALLALATWWLVQNTPRPEAPRETAAPRHEPDYSMQGFTLQRFGSDGRLRVQVQGTHMRHYPDTDTLEIDGVTIRAFSLDGSVTLATARRAVANGDASEVQLLGGAHVVREGVGAERQLEFNSEFLHAFLSTERLRSHLPVRLRQGTSDLRVGGIDYDNLSRSAQLGGPVRARFAVPRR
jgi:lipopolysaccharide export system protein LptC